MRMRMDDIITRFIRDAGKADADFYSDDHLQGILQGRLNGNDTIFSYGRHFPLAEIMPDAAGNRRGWWLVNGDTWGGGGGFGMATSTQQTKVRNAIKIYDNLPMLTVPFSAITRSGIKPETIKITEILPDRYTWEPRTQDDAPKDWQRGQGGSYRNWRKLADGRWSFEESVHHLGEAVFTADYSYEERPPRYMDLTTHEWVRPASIWHKGHASFISAFDMNEGFGLYFLAQLPEGVHPQTVAEAVEALKPNLVKGAEHLGVTVLRQGDVFAIEHKNLTTRQLPGPSERGAYVLDVNHKVTEVRHDKSGTTYGRGFMRHAPAGRQPEHRMVKLGDGKTWFELVKNTVPMGRAWTIEGRVD